MCVFFFSHSTLVTICCISFNSVYLGKEKCCPRNWCSNSHTYSILLSMSLPISLCPLGLLLSQLVRVPYPFVCKLTPLPHNTIQHTMHWCFILMLALPAYNALQCTVHCSYSLMLTLLGQTGNVYTKWVIVSIKLT
jgi:hypothetical protein